MRLVAVSIVKNEADIIEAFVRHTLAWVDHHLIFDHDSTDGTRQILGALQAEGLAITLFTDDVAGNLQQVRSNHLTRVAAQKYAADWILPLDADEILTGPSRTALESNLTALVGLDRPASLLLLNYYPTDEDDATVINPVLRLRFCQSLPPRTKKIMIPRQLALAPEISAGKGSHALYRGTELLPDQPLPVDFHLCHLALRSPQHQVLRVVLRELQKLSEGKTQSGLDVHYRLGFQLLAENPELFFATVNSPEAALRLQPIAYCGAPLKPNHASVGWYRVAQALLPYLEKLAASHGQLVDGQPATISSGHDIDSVIREMRPGEVSARLLPPNETNFSGFVADSGWGEQEGPVPEAFLPPFHWGFAPATHLTIHTGSAHRAHFMAEGLTYSENQTVRVALNGATLLEKHFPRINQKEIISVPLALHAGENQLSIHYSQCLVTDFDRRKLAVIFLSLRVLDSAVT